MDSKCLNGAYIQKMIKDGAKPETVQEAARATADRHFSAKKASSEFRISEITLQRQPESVKAAGASNKIASTDEHALHAFDVY